ncbi:Alpha/Beta hydrolase protein [Dipodascopsis tothii]|uniref:Alpha/Beta hydrolase protein n=1 Tax=Dipodascopsis tothii TaxID=44089 RepID=UPI0034CFC21C
MRASVRTAVRAGASLRQAARRGGLIEGGRAEPHGSGMISAARRVGAQQRASSAAAAVAAPAPVPRPSNQPMAFPCLDALESRTRALAPEAEEANEPTYTQNLSGYQVFHSAAPLHLDHGGVLHEYDIAYETWGTLNADASNAVLLHTGLSASQHAKSHAANPSPGWWERFIGPGAAIDTDRYFVICTNVIGGCYGSSGPSSLDPLDGQRYATRFPIVTVQDMTRAQHELVRSLGIRRLHASVGASMGGMQSLAYATQFPDAVGRVVSISGCARSHPYSIALRHAQRQVLMADPNWRRGFYYDSVPPHAGMKLAREIATITYRSGPEWEQRFGRKRADPTKPTSLCADFLIETYLDHQGEKFCLQYDANSLLYVSKAMDLFDLGASAQRQALANRAAAAARGAADGADTSAMLTCPYPPPSDEQQRLQELADEVHDDLAPHADLVKGMAPLRDTPVFVLGVDSDILFPAWQQREIVDVLREAGNRQVEHVELGQELSLFGHDTFLLSLDHVGGPVKRFLEQ